MKLIMCELYNTPNSSFKSLRSQDFKSEEILVLWNALTNLARNFKIFLDKSYVKIYPTSRKGSADSKPSKESTLSGRLTRRESKSPLSLISEFLQFIEIFFLNFSEIEFTNCIAFKKAYEDMFR